MQLNKESVPPRSKNAKGLYQTTIRQIKINPAYKGEAIVYRHCNIADINKVDLSKAIRITIPPIVSNNIWDSAQSRLVNNKHIKPTDDGLFTLQGLIRCGSCGYSYRTDRIRYSRYYMCRGKLKVAHPDGSPKCTNKNIRAEYLEQAVWKRVTEIIDDPNKLEPLLVDAINKLKERESELEANVLPVERRLKDIKEMKSRLADKWIQENMDPAKYKVAQQNLDKVEVRLMSVRRGSDSDQLAELERTRSILTFWQNQVKTMVWNSEDETKEERVMIRRIDEPHKTILTLLGLNDKSLSESYQFPTSQRELYDKLQLSLVVFENKIEVKSLFPIPDISNQECSSMRGLVRMR